jgi:FixJ family two-component response regulator
MESGSSFTTANDKIAGRRMHNMSRKSDELLIHSSGPLISVVDDDDVVREALRNLIVSLGYAAVSFCSAEEYLSSGIVLNTACLVSDVQMPGMTGLDLQARMITDGHQIPIIYVTAFTDEQTRARALEGGAVGLLIKPVNQDELINCLERALAVVRTKSLQSSNDRFAGPRARFLQRAIADVAALKASKNELCNKETAGASLEHIVATAHRLAGGGGTVGIGEISTSALALEQCAIAALAGNDTVANVEAALDTLSNAVALRAAAPRSTLCKRI